jgi:hypothetical protein
MQRAAARSITRQTNHSAAVRPRAKQPALPAVPASTSLAESPAEIVWMKNATDRQSLETAENSPILHSFLLCETTSYKSEVGYTFERFASNRHDIRTTYYYHYKRNILGLKEETTWS